MPEVRIPPIEVTLVVRAQHGYEIGDLVRFETTEGPIFGRITRLDLEEDRASVVFQGEIAGQLAKDFLPQIRLSRWKLLMG